MTVYYVGPGGNDGLAGTSWAARFLTLGKAATSVAAGDTVYVGPGTYRELLTIGVSGTVGNVITWNGDYTGANTDGVGGIVRVTGSNDDKVATRANCITATSKNYNTFNGFQFDTTTSTVVNLVTCQNITVNRCAFAYATPGQANIVSSGATQLALLVQNCLFQLNANSQAVYMNHSADVAAVGHVIQNCIISGMNAATAAILSSKVRGITVSNAFIQAYYGIQVSSEGSAGATHFTVNNCIFHGCNFAFVGVALGDIVEDYNDISNCSTARSNTNTGANSLAYVALTGTRWFFQLVFAGAGPNSIKQLATPFDLSAASQLINVAGTSPTATDMRGTGTIGAQREWGALEYDSTLKIQGGVNKSRVQTGM